MTTTNGVMPIWMLFGDEDDDSLRRLWYIVKDNPLNPREYGCSFHEFKGNWIKQKKIRLG